MTDKKSGVTVSTSGESRFFFSPAEYYQYLKDNPTIFIEGFVVSFEGDFTVEELDGCSIPSIESV